MFKSFINKYLKKNENGINLIGLFDKAIGISEVGRSFQKYLVDLKIPNVIKIINSPVHEDISENEIKQLSYFINKEKIYNINLIFINADGISHIKSLNPDLYNSKINIGIFWWEFEDYFYFDNVYKEIDKILVFSSFVKKAILKRAPSDFEVIQLKFPFIKQWEITKSISNVRNQYNISNDTFLFFFNFDFHSSYERKNPSAILEAFSNAFDIKDDVKIVFKTSNAKFNKNAYNEFLDQIKKYDLEDKIIFIEETLSKNSYMELLNACNCYISLHKSEGFGIGLLEALSIGKPVIATNYGGCTDFLNNENSMLIDYEMCEVQNEFGPYKKGWLWANPDILQASKMMRKVFEDREFAKNKGIAGYRYVKKEYSKKKIKKEIKYYLLQKLQI